MLVFSQRLTPLSSQSTLSLITAFALIERGDVSEEKNVWKICSPCVSFLMSTWKEIRERPNACVFCASSKNGKHQCWLLKYLFVIITVVVRRATMKIYRIQGSPSINKTRPARSGTNVTQKHVCF